MLWCWCYCPWFKIIFSFCSSLCSLFPMQNSFPRHHRKSDYLSHFEMLRWNGKKFNCLFSCSISDDSKPQYQGNTSNFYALTSLKLNWLQSLWLSFGNFTIVDWIDTCSIRPPLLKIFNLCSYNFSDDSKKLLWKSK